MSSLLIAGTITYLAVVLLSLYQNFTLELACIALIVAIGITAELFVIYFERLRDEVREGKQLRPAVESGGKPDEFLTQGRDRHPCDQPLDPGQDVAEP